VALVLPLAGIVALGGWMLLRPPPAAETRRVDQNDDMMRLAREVDLLEKEGHEVIQSIRKEKKGAAKAGQALSDKIDKWLDGWDVLSKDLKNADGSLRAEYAGYGELRKRMNTLRNDLVKVSGF
jgi:hypothetical protein